MLDKNIAAKLNENYGWIDSVPVAVSISDADTLELIKYNELFSGIFDLSDLGNNRIVLNGLKKETGSKSVLTLSMGDVIARLFTTVTVINVEGKSFLLAIHENLINLIDSEDTDKAVDSLEKALKNKNTQIMILDCDEEYMVSGVYNRKGGLNILEKHMDVSYDNGKFAMAYFILEAIGEQNGAEHLENAMAIVKNAVRQTDILAKMEENEYIIIFPRCAYEVVDSILGTIAKKIEALNEALNSNCGISIEYSISEYNSENKQTPEEFIAKLKKELE